MRRILLISLTLYSALLKAQDINTIAGSGNGINSGDEGPAILAGIKLPGAPIFDKHNNLYFAAGPTVRMITPDGKIHTIAGNGMQGNTGDGGLATNAKLNQPQATAIDSAGNIFIAEAYNNKIRRVDKVSGIITTIAGNGTAGYGGDGGPATNAILNTPIGLCLDKKGNLYVSDYQNSRVRKIDVLGMISTYAGTGVPGYNGDGGSADTSQLDSPFGICIDDTGNLYIADITGRIRKVDTFGIIHSLAGNGIPGYSGDNSLAVNAQVQTEFLTVDKFGNIYTTEGNGHRIRKIDSVGKITTVGGNGNLGFAGDGGPVTASVFYTPQGVTTDTCGNLYIADTHNFRIRKVGYYPNCSITDTTIVDTTDTTTAVLNILHKDNDVHIYPNPAKENVTVSYSSSAAEISIINMLAQTIVKEKSKGHKAVLNVAGLSSGVYFINVRHVNSGLITVRRFLKE